MSNKKRTDPCASLDHRCKSDGCQNDRIDLTGYCAEHPRETPSSCAAMHIDVERYEALMVVLAHARAAVDAPDTTRVMHALSRLSSAIAKADQFTSPAPKEEP